jgi:hypothetical protein
MEDLFAKVRVMVFNATFNNISIIYPEKTIGYQLSHITGEKHYYKERYNLEHYTRNIFILRYTKVVIYIIYLISIKES